MKSTTVPGAFHLGPFHLDNIDSPSGMFEPPPGHKLFVDTMLLTSSKKWGQTHRDSQISMCTIH